MVPGPDRIPPQTVTHMADDPRIGDISTQRSHVRIELRAFFIILIAVVSTTAAGVAYHYSVVDTLHIAIDRQTDRIDVVQSDLALMRRELWTVRDQERWAAIIREENRGVMRDDDYKHGIRAPDPAVIRAQRMLGTDEGDAIHKRR